MGRPLKLAPVLLALAACAPGKFDELREPAGRLDAGLDATAEDDGASAEDDARSAEDAETDAGQAPTDAGDSACPEAPDGGRKLELLGEPIELARLSDPDKIKYRTLTSTAWLGNSRIWTFANTTPNPVGDAGAVSYLSVAYDGVAKPWTHDAGTGQPWKLNDKLEPNGLPAAFLSVTPDEAASYVSLSVPSVIKRPDSDTGGLAFVRKSVGFFGATEVWLADVEEGATTATLRAGPLFAGGELLFSMGAHRGLEYVKLFACKRIAGATAQDPDTFPCYLARVPLAKVGERAAYQVRTAVANGPDAWSYDFELAAPVFYGIDSDLSVSWNEHLGQALAVHSKDFSNSVVFHTAPTIDGPWSDAAEVALPQPDTWWIGSAREQPGLVQRCGKRIIITHWAPSDRDPASGFPTNGEVVMSAIDLK